MKITMTLDNPIQILHLTPHFGGGVGTVMLGNLLYSNQVDSDLRHSVVCLDYLNEHSKKQLIEHRIPFSDSMYWSQEALLDQIKHADVILVHWWNHPLLTDFLIRNRLPECRLILWCHITGSPAPNNLTSKILKYPDRFIFTTPMSYTVPEYMRLSDQEKNGMTTIWSTAGVERLSKLVHRPGDGFHVGYIGNLDPTKINPQFIELCRSIKIPGVRFTVVGPENKQLQEQAARANLLDRIHFTGFVSEDEKWAHLSTFDVFGYPLARHHYGSCDQAIQEAMAAGVPPVVLNNRMESYMVRDGETGLIVNDETDYPRAVESLFTDPDLRSRLGSNAKKYATEVWSIKQSAAQWREEFIRILSQPKREKDWGIEHPEKLTAAEIFMESLGDHAGPFRQYLSSESGEHEQAIRSLKELSQSRNWTSPTKSTAHQFLGFFPSDTNLKKWSDLTR